MDRFSCAGEIVKGSLRIDRRRIASALKGMPDGDVIVTVEREKAKRTTQQNRFYWKTLVEAIVVETGQDRQSVHEALKRECNARHVEMVNKRTGEVHESWVGGTTTALSTAEFTAYLERCRAFAAQFFGLTFEEQTP